MASELFAARTLKKRTNFDSSKEDIYILDIVACVQDSEECLLAVAGSSNYVNMYDMESLCPVNQLEVEQGIVGGRISKLCYSNHQIWCSCTDGTIRAWDPRKNARKAVCRLQGYSSEPFNCVAVSTDGHLLAGSTDKVGEDASIYLWDIRTGRSPIAQFTESHGDDITHVAFSPSSSRHMASGSTDGLVCLFDLSTLDEEEATLSVKNSQSSVASVGYFGSSSEFVYCLTHQETFHIWNTSEEKVKPIGTHENIREIMAEKYGLGTSNYYLVDCHYEMSSQRLFLLAGDHSGGVYVLHANPSNVFPVGLITGGHSATVRAVHWSEKNNCIFSGGEDGVLCVWKPKEQQST